MQCDALCPNGTEWNEPYLVGEKARSAERRATASVGQSHRENQEQQADVPSRCLKSVCQQSHSRHDTKKGSTLSFMDVVLPRIIFAVKLANTLFWQCDALCLP